MGATKVLPNIEIDELPTPERVLIQKNAKGNQLMKLKFSPMGATKVLPKIESLKRQPQIAAASVVAAAAATVADNTAPST